MTLFKTGFEITSITRRWFRTEMRGDIYKLTKQGSQLHIKDEIVQRRIFLDTLGCSSGVLCLLGTHQMLLTDEVRNVT